MTTDSLHGYVRFYLAVVRELGEVLRALAAVDGATREALAPFAQATACAEAPPAAAELSTEELWQPADPEHLTGLVDVYEVVGRFSFQGEDDANLRALAGRVAAARAEIARLRALLAALALAPARAVARAEALMAEDLARTKSQQGDLLERFEPVAATLREQCARALDAIRAVKKPELARTESAEAQYQDYVRKVRSLYATALPYLRKELAELSRIAGCEVPPSWPDALPFAPALPPELVASPAEASPALAQLRAALEALGAQESQLLRAQDELGVQLRGREGESASLAQREGDLLREANLAKGVVRWATRLDELDALRAQSAAVQEEGQRRTRVLAELAAEQQRVTAALGSIQAEATELARAVTAREAELARQRENEPALFGKDEWRRKVEELDAEITEGRALLSRKQQSLVAGNGEYAGLKGREQAEQAQIAALARTVGELRTREASMAKELAEIEQELGAARPARRLTVAQAEETLAAIWSARNEARARIERLAAEARKLREELDRVAVTLRQVATEKQRQQAGMAQVTQQATSAHEDAVRALAARRQAGFESHVGSVLGGMEESLAQVDRIFVEPARRVLLERAGIVSPAVGVLRAQAAGLAQALPEVARRVEAALDAQAAQLDRIDRDFVQRAPSALPPAWETA